MKHIKHILFFTCAALLFACNKKLDLPSDGRIPLDQVFADYNQTRGYLNSCYGYLPSAYLERASYTDEAQDADDNNANFPRYTSWYTGTATARNYDVISADSSPWGILFQGINKCNMFIENMKTATVLAAEEEKAGWIAQARTLRALYYLQLIKRYGGVPIFDKPLEIDHDFSSDRRAGFSEVVTFILADCDAALTAPDQNTATTFSWNVYDNQFGIMNRAVAHAIKSQAVTYAASPLWSDGTYTWDVAAQITATALQECLAHDYKLFDVAPPAGTAQNAYALYFLTNPNDQRAVDKETILNASGRLSVWSNAGLPSIGAGIKAGSCPTQDLVDSYEMANGEAPVTGYSDANRLVPVINPASGYDPNDPYAGRDPRFYASVYYNGALRYLDQPGGDRVETFVGGDEGISQTNRRNTRTGYYIRKYNNFRSDLNNQADGFIRLFRVAELYLNFAEAAYHSVGPDVPVTVNGVSLTAREAVNAVRARAGMPDFPAGMSAEDFEKKYRNERRIEFAFEEHRFFDVRRWKILSETDKFVTGMRITESGGNLTYTRFKFTNRDCSSDKWLMYPINQAEVIKIIGLSGQDWQNPGWLD
ncbi:MAG: RagB/SusD family nutrient uptake outer membrane protein [Chitinophagaceae bacterium]|nr:RagB/SusD family nutrient uptake outer membrane protein [Chitinophagaceae bacterium]